MRILKVTSQKYVFILLFIFFFIVRIIWHMLNKIYCDFLTIRCIPNSLPPNYKLATSNAGWWLGVSSLSATFLMEIKSLLCGNSRNVAVLRLRLWGQGPVSGPVWRVQDPSRATLRLRGRGPVSGPVWRIQDPSRATLRLWGRGPVSGPVWRVQDPCSEVVDAEACSPSLDWQW